MRPDCFLLRLAALGAMFAAAGGHAQFLLEFRHPAAVSHVRLTVFQSKEGELAWWKNRLFSVSD